MLTQTRNIGRYYDLIQGNDNCRSIANRNGLTLLDLYAPFLVLSRHCLFSITTPYHVPHPPLCAANMGVQLLHESVGELHRAQPRHLVHAGPHRAAAKWPVSDQLRRALGGVLRVCWAVRRRERWKGIVVVISGVVGLHVQLRMHIRRFGDSSMVVMSNIFNFCSISIHQVSLNRKSQWPSTPSSPCQLKRHFHTTPS